MDRVVDKAVFTRNNVGTVAPCRREVYAYGETDLSGSQAVDEYTIFAVGSKFAPLDWPIEGIQGVKHV